MPGRGMSDMIQLIATLSEIQQRRRQLDLQEREMQMRGSQFAQSMGFQEKSEEFKKFMQVLDRYAAASAESRGAFADMGKSLGFTEEQIASGGKYLGGAPVSPQVLAAEAANRGAAQATPQSDLESYLGATTGMNQGQAAMSGLTGQVAGEAGRQFAAQQAMPSAQRPGSFTQAIQGITPGWGQFQQADIGRGQVQADYYRTNASMIANAQDTAAKLSSFKAMGMLTADQRIQGYNTMLQVLKEMRAKGGNDAGRLANLALFNRIAATVDPSLVIQDPDSAPDEATLIQRMQQSISPPGVPGQAPPVNGPPMQGTGMLPQNNFQMSQQWFSPFVQQGPAAGRPQFQYPPR